MTTINPNVPAPQAAQNFQPLAANGAQVPSPNGINIPGVVWRYYHVKSALDGEKQKVVAGVTVPEFDEKNVEAGLAQIQAYPWDNEELNGGVSYPNWAAAVISLVNTQHGTNVRNRARQQNSGRVSAAEVRVAALNRIPPAEMQAAMQQGGLAMVQLMERYEKMVKEEMNAKKGNNDEAAPSSTPAPVLPGQPA